MEAWMLLRVAGSVGAGRAYVVARRSDEHERTRRTLYRAVVVVVLSALRVRTEDIERRLRAVSDDGARRGDG